MATPRRLARLVIRAAIGAATRHPWLRRAAALAVAPFPRLRPALLRLGTGPVSLPTGGGRAAGSAPTAAERQAATSLGAASGVVFQQLRAAIHAHGG